MSLRASSFAKAVRSSTEAILSFVEWKIFWHTLISAIFFNVCLCLSLFLSNGKSDDAEQTIVHAAGRLLRSEESNARTDLSQSQNLLNRDPIYWNSFFNWHFKWFIWSQNKIILDRLFFNSV